MRHFLLKPIRMLVGAFLFVYGQGIVRIAQGKQYLLGLLIKVKKLSETFIKFSQKKKQVRQIDRRSGLKKEMQWYPTGNLDRTS